MKLKQWLSLPLAARCWQRPRDGGREFASAICA